MYATVSWLESVLRKGVGSTIPIAIEQEDVMDRRKFLGTTAAAGARARSRSRYIAARRPSTSCWSPSRCIRPATCRCTSRWPKDYFAEADIEVKIVTIETGGGHTNAVLSGQAFAFIGGPEHNAFAKAKGAELRAVVNCVDRGNVYFCAAKGHEPKDTDWPAYFKGKSIARQPLRRHAELDHALSAGEVEARRQERRHAARDAELGACRPRVRTGQAQIGVTTEPMITQGVKQGFWSEPFFNIPKELGPYAYSTINIRLDSIQKEPEVVRGFVRGMMKGLKFLYADKDGAAEIAKKQFPTMALDDLKATLDRSFADEMWSTDGMISRGSLGHRQGRGAWAPASSRPTSNTTRSST